MSKKRSSNLKSIAMAYHKEIYAKWSKIASCNKQDINNTQARHYSKTVSRPKLYSRTYKKLMALENSKH